MKNSWFLIYLCTSTGDHELKNRNPLGFHEAHDFDENSLCWLSLSTSTGVCSHTCDLHNELLDPQGEWGQTLLEFDQSGKGSEENSRYNEFVTTPVAFNLNFPKIMIFDDLGKAIMNIIDLRLPDGPGRWVGAISCLKRDLKRSRSSLSSKSMFNHSTGIQT